jgi:putative transposase
MPPRRRWAHFGRLRQADGVRHLAPSHPKGSDPLSELDSGPKGACFRAAGFLLLMARRPRENLHGGIYHVFARGNAGIRVYADDVDRAIYLHYLERGLRRTGVRCLAYCLLTTHMHLLLETPEANLSDLMHRVHSSYAQAFNVRHDRFGHLFQGRYGAVRIETDAQLVAVARYIAQNPVEAGLCAEPEEWRWSSAWFTNGHPGPDWLEQTNLGSLLQ